jgi:hypothetical protein
VVGDLEMRKERLTMRCSESHPRFALETSGKPATRLYAPRPHPAGGWLESLVHYTMGEAALYEAVRKGTPLVEVTIRFVEGIDYVPAWNRR